MSKGYVYILTNDSMPGLLKIGKTVRDVQFRASELSNASGVPTPFRVAHYVMAPDCDGLEVSIHEHLHEFRVNSSREFFKIDLVTAICKLENTHLTQVQGWLDEFMPDHTMVRDEDFIDIGSFHPSVASEAHQVGLTPPDFAEAITLVNPDEIRPALTRMKSLSDRRVSEYRKEKSLKVVS